MRFLAILFPLLTLSPVAMAQIVFQGGSFQTSVSATIPGCTDNAGAVGVSPASAFCSAGGYSAVASGAAGFSTHAQGGEVTASADAAATSTGGPPLQQSNAISTNNAGANWTLSVPTHYSLVTETSGGAFVNFSGAGVPFPPPASGVLTGSAYGLAISTNANAIANDSNGAEIVTAIPQTGTASVTFAEVDSPTLIMGTVLAGGVPMANLVVEALDGVVVVATTRTGNDSTYLLDGIGVSVTLRLSDPSGQFAEETSPLLTPPATYDADLEVNTKVPVLGGPVLVGLALVLALVGARVAAHRRSESTPHCSE